MNGLKRNSILVIDDDPAIRKVLSLGLERLGYEVTLAKNGQEGIDLLEKPEWEPDIILLDIRMPVLTGREALPRIKTMKPLTPVIMLTAYNDLATGLEMMKSGAFDFLVKPTRLEQISETIQRAVRFKDLMRDKIEQDRRNEEYKKNLEITMESRTAELNETYQKLKAANLQTVEVLAETIEAKDHYTQGHCQRVRMISVRIAKALQFPKEKIEALEFAALLHDIGKIGIPESILNKPGPLNQDEIEIIKMHPLIGAQILSIVEFFSPAINGVRHHHERWDGTGYPDKVSGNDIDPLAQIITLADTFDAMAQSRPYRKALELDFILEEISYQRGRQFSPAVVDVFLEGKLYEGFMSTMDKA